MIYTITYIHLLWLFVVAAAYLAGKYIERAARRRHLARASHQLGEVTALYHHAALKWGEAAAGWRTAEERRQREFREMRSLTLDICHMRETLVMNN